MSEEGNNSVVDAILKEQERSRNGNSNNNSNSSGNYGVDLRNYYNPEMTLDEKETKGQKVVRILPNPEGGNPFYRHYVHEVPMKDNNNRTRYRKFVCPKQNWGDDCPFCEAEDALRKEAETKEEKRSANKYRARLFYVAKVIDRDEPDRVKFWRFRDRNDNQGVYDKIATIVETKQTDITDAENGRDLVISLVRDNNNKVSITGIADKDASPISDDEDTKDKFLQETKEKSWSDYFRTKPYEYLEILVKGGTPAYDKTNDKFYDKEQSQGVRSESHSSEDDSEDLGVGSEGGEGPSESSGGSETSSSAESEEDDEDDLPF